MSKINIKVGDFIVYEHTFGYALRGEVSKVTDASAYVPSYGGKTRRVSFDNIVFSGKPDIAAKLEERLTSSRSLLHEEERKARVRHQERDKKMIDAALSPTGEAGR